MACSYCSYLVNALRLCACVYACVRACVRGDRETAVTHTCSLTRIGRDYTRTHKFTYTSIHIFGGPALLSCLFALFQELKQWLDTYL